MAAPVVALAGGWRVKLYELEAGGAWIDKGTGYVTCRVSDSMVHFLMVTNEDKEGEMLLATRIRGDGNYELQGENIIMWREMDDADPGSDTDYALSFQETTGCSAIWEAIGSVEEQFGGPDGTGIARQSAVGSGSMSVDELNSSPGPHPFQVLPAQVADLAQLTALRDRLVNLYPNQRDFAVAQLTDNDCQYLLDLFRMFVSFEAEDNAEGLSRMAEVFRHFCLLNDSGLIEYFFSTDDILSQVVHIFEFDHTLARRASYRDFLFRTATLREVVPHNSPELSRAMTYLFRLRYFRDIILHPAVDEPGVSALSSMIIFSSFEISSKLFENAPYLARVLKTVKPSLDISSICNEECRPTSSQPTEELTRVNTSVTTLSEDNHYDTGGANEVSSVQCEANSNREEDISDSGSSSSSSSGLSSSSSSSEDDAEPSPKRARGSKQPSEDGPEVPPPHGITIVTLSMAAVAANNKNSPKTSRELVLRIPNPHMAKAFSLDEDSILSTATDIITAAPPAPVESLPKASPVDGCRFMRELFFLSKGLPLEKRSELFRKFYESAKRPFLEVLLFVLGYQADYGRFACAPEDAMSETDLGQCHVLLCEVLAGLVAVSPVQVRQVLLAEPVVVIPPCNVAMPVKEGTRIPYQNSLFYLMIDIVVNGTDTACIDHIGDALKTLLDHDKAPVNSNPNASEPVLTKAQQLQMARDNKEKDALIALYYDSYVTWLFAPFHDDNLPHRSVPDSYYAHRGVEVRHPRQTQSAIVASRRVIFENLIQGIVQHSYRMKYFIMRNAGVISKTLSKVFSKEVGPANKWLYVYANKFIRAILSTKDEFYYKHVDKTDMLRPLLTHLKSHNCKDNMFTSCVYELVDYIRRENIKVLILYIVNKYADCFAESKASVFDQLKVRYDQIMDGQPEPPSSDSSLNSSRASNSSYTTLIDSKHVPVSNAMRSRTQASQKRFREVDVEEDYFFGEDDDDSPAGSPASPAGTSAASAVSPKAVDTAAVAASKLKVAAEDRAKLVVIGSQKPIYSSYADMTSGKRSGLYSSNRILGTGTGSNSSGSSSSNSSSSSSSAGCTSRNFSNGQPVHGSNGRTSPYRLSGVISTGDEEDDGEDAWFSMSPTTAAAARAASPVNDENSVASSSKRQRANDGSSIDRSRSPLAPLGEGVSGASALFSMLSEYGDDGEEPRKLARPVPRSGHSVIVDIYDEALTSIRKDSDLSTSSADSVVRRFERGVDIFSDAGSRSGSVVASVSADEEQLGGGGSMDYNEEEEEEEENLSPERAGLPPLRAKFGTDDDDEGVAPVFAAAAAAAAKGSGVISPKSSKGLAAGFGKSKPRHPVIHFKTALPSQDLTGQAASESGSCTGVTVGGSGAANDE